MLGKCKQSNSKGKKEVKISCRKLTNHSKDGQAEKDLKEDPENEAQEQYAKGEFWWKYSWANNSSN